MLNLPKIFNQKLLGQLVVTSMILLMGRLLDGLTHIRKKDQASWIIFLLADSQKLISEPLKGNCCKAPDF